ncbi:MAG: hypothetical protein K2X57_00565 [Xanthobacteraceae bacterium]|nr:hypothetical protein [Xanthobacteraceae bacterium]
MTTVTTIHSLIKELEPPSPKIAALDLCSTIQDEQIDGERSIFGNNHDEIRMVGRSAEKLLVSQAALRKMMTDLLSQKNFYGQLCEFAVYDWLQRNEAGFQVQIPLTGAEVLNRNGTDIDGLFEGRDVYFDIKGFGFEAYVREKFRAKLESMVNKGRITIDGARDNAVKDIEGAFRKLKDLTTELHQAGIAKIPELDWTLRTSTSSLTVEMNTVDPYWTAEENWYYPFKTARQFHRGAAFVLVFAFSPTFNGLMSVNFEGSTDVVLRSLARRAFLQTKGDATPISKLDPAADPTLSLDQAAQLLSGILFLNFANDKSWLFLNPRAARPLKKDFVPQIFDFMLPHGMAIDDFAHDNY